MTKKWAGTIALLACSAGSAVNAAPFRDPMPQKMFGNFAPSAAACNDPDGVDVMVIDAEGMHYYEGDNFLLLGIEFGGMTLSGRSAVVLFNGRFTGRSETQLLGEMSARLELETEDLLSVYAIADNGEPIAKSRVSYIRCKPRG